MKSTLLAVALALAASGAFAQTVYMKVGLDGHKTFSDVPDIAAQSVPERADAAEQRRTPVGTMAEGSRRATQVNTNEAQRRLTQAQLKRWQGLAPLAGELTGVGSARAVNYRYWQRQEKLRLGVELAQRRSSETQRPQLASR